VLASLRAVSTREEAEAAVGQVISRAGDPARMSAAVREAMAQAGTVEARCALLRLLDVCPDSAALEAVTGALKSPDARMKEAAMRTLSDWPNPQAWDALTGVYRQAGSESERVVALRGLARLLGEQNAQPGRELISRYGDLLERARSDEDRKLILGALAGCADPGALALAVGELSHAGARAESELAVRKIAEAVKGTNPQAAREALEKLK
jgi:hypothetical protein